MAYFNSLWAVAQYNFDTNFSNFSRVRQLKTWSNGSVIFDSITGSSHMIVCYPSLTQLGETVEQLELVIKFLFFCEVVYCYFWLDLDGKIILFFTLPCASSKLIEKMSNYTYPFILLNHLQEYSDVKFLHGDEQIWPHLPFLYLGTYYLTTSKFTWFHSLCQSSQTNR